MNRLLANAVLLCFSLALTFGGAEIAVRLLLPRDDFNMAHARVPDPVLGWKVAPGASYTNRIGGGEFSVLYNARGWHDVEHDFAKPPGTMRIVVLGDSFMEAYSVPLEASFARRLESALGEDGRTVEVINVSAGGFGTLQQYLAFREEGVRYAPDLVLVGFYVGNDVRNNSRELEARVWDGTNIKVSSRPFLESEARGAFEISRIDYEGALKRYEEGRVRAEGGLIGTLRRHSALVSFVWSRVRGLQVNAGGLAVDEGNGAPDYYRALLGVDLCQESAEYGAAWQLTARILRRFRKDVEAAGARLAVFSVPALAQVDTQDQRALVANTGEPEAFCLEQAPGHRRLAELCAQEAIPFIELLPAFRSAARDSGLVLFHAEDRHWNRAGHALAVHEVQRALKTRGLLAPPPEASPRQRGALPRGQATASSPISR